MSTSVAAAVRPLEAPAGFLRSVFGGVQLTPSLVGLCWYTFAIITFHAPGAKWAMIVCLAGLLLQLDKLRWAPVLSWMTAFIAWCWVTVFANGAAPDSMDTAIDLTKVGLVCFAGYNTVQSRAQLRFFLCFVTGAVLLYPMRGALLNFALGITVGGRIVWTYVYENPNELAAFSLLYLAIALGFFALARHRLWRLGALGAAGVIAFVILLTQSRGAFLALLVATSLALGTQRRRLRTALAVLVGAVVLVPFVPDSTWARFKGLLNISVENQMANVDREGSAAQRFQLMKVAAKIAQDRPVFGVGVGMYPVAHRQYAAEYRSELPLAGGNRDAHNAYLRVAAELGFPGLALFLGMIGTAIALARRTSKQAAVGDPGAAQAAAFLMLGLVAYLVAGMFHSGGYLNVLYLMLFMLASVVTLASAAPRIATRSAPLVPVPVRPQGVRGGLAMATTWEQAAGRGA